MCTTLWVVYVVGKCLYTFLNIICVLNCHFNFGVFFFPFDIKNLLVNWFERAIQLFYVCFDTALKVKGLVTGQILAISAVFLISQVMNADL